MAEPTPIASDDIYLFRQGTHHRLYRRLGSHPVEGGVFFAVWAPNARAVSVIGDFNDWEPGKNPLSRATDSPIWEGVVPGIAPGAWYKYQIASELSDYQVDKTDPFAFYREVPPASASIVWELDYQWRDQDWMSERARHNALDEPWSIYEMHLGSWRRRGSRSDSRPLTYRELAQELPGFVKEMGFTHVELLPVMEHPYYPSWGYQVTGFFAPSARYGTPQELMGIIDALHRNGIGVILDWVPSHFPSDAHGLGFFDGTYLYEHAHPAKRVHPDWQTLQFNYGRPEVRSFLKSSALFWLDRYHVDALRVDAVASMLYLDYSRDEGEWEPNRHGGREHLEAIDFLKELNQAVYESYPDTQTIAEESTAWPMVSRPPYVGGLGFGMKWDMGFMHDTLDYFAERPEHRKFHHEKLTFRPIYAFSENFTLPLSHDEVVHGKGSLLTRMPGDDWQQFANLRLLYGYMWGQPGKKLLFMGGEIGQRREWSHDESIEWFVLEHPLHAGVKRWVASLNRLYREHPALYRDDFSPEGFRWIDCRNTGESIVSFERRGEGESLVCLYNFDVVPHPSYRLGVPRAGRWQECLNSDHESFGGAGRVNPAALDATDIACHELRHSVELQLPPLGAVFLRPLPRGDEAEESPAE